MRYIFERHIHVWGVFKTYVRYMYVYEMYMHSKYFISQATPWKRQCGNILWTMLLLWPQNSWGFFFIFKSSSPDEIQASAQNYGSSTKFLYQRSTHTVEFVCLLVRSARFAVVFSPCGALTTLSVYWHGDLTVYQVAVARVSCEEL